MKRAALVLASVLLLNQAGDAAAPQAYFRAMSSSTNPARSPTLVPPENAAPARPLDFGDGSTADYRISTVVGEPYSLEMTTVNGLPAITWLPPPPDLPSGFSYLDGVIWGEATAPFAGVRSFLALDGTGAQATGRVTFDIVDPAVSLSDVKALVRVGSPYVGNLASNVRGAAYSLSGAPGVAATAPDAQSRAALAGTATTPGTYPIIARVGRPGTAITATSRPTNVTVAPGLELAFSPPYVTSLAGSPVDIEVHPEGVVGKAALALVSPAASVLSARGLTYANGRLTGTLAQGAATALTLRLTDSADSASVTASLAIPASTGEPAAIEIGEMRPGAMPEVVPGEPARIVTAIPNPVCTVTQAVPGISVTSDCVIMGAATAPGSYTLEISIVPSSNPEATSIVISAPIVVHPALVAKPSGSVQNAVPGTPVHLAVGTSGIVGTPSYRLIGTTPEALASIGLTFDPIAGTVTGVPDPGVALDFEIEVTDSQDGARSRGAFTVVISAPSVSVETAVVNLRPGRVVTRQATTNVANPRWSLLGAPDYITIHETTGLVTYLGPNASEIAVIPAFAVRATNATSPQIFRDMTVATPGTVRPNLSATFESVSGTIGQAIAPVPFTLVGASSPRFTIIAPGLQGLSIELGVGGGRFSGTPTEAGSGTRRVTITDDSDGDAIQRDLTISIGQTLVATAPTKAIYDATPGQNVSSDAPSFSGAHGNVVWVIESPNGTAAPSGTSVNATTGVVTATSTASGDVSVRLIAKDYVGGKVVQTAVTTPITFQFRSVDASVARPNSASTTNAGTYGNGSSIVDRLYDGNVGTNTGVTLYGTTSSVTLTYTSPTEVDCATISAELWSYGGTTGNLKIQSYPNAVAGASRSVGTGGTIPLDAGPTRQITLSFSGTNNHKAYVHTFKVGIMQPNGTCKTAP